MKTINKQNWQQTFCRSPTPLQKISSQKSIEIYVKRDDLNHAHIQGNKLRKLKHNIKQALDNKQQQLATFGGAYSNHIIAVAHAAQICGIESLGFIRGEELELKPEKWSQTLLKAQSLGMQLKFLNRKEYRKKQDSMAVINTLENSNLKTLLIPEGGSNDAAIVGVKEIIDEIHLQNLSPTYIICACGTGGTLAGLIEGVAQHKMKTHIIGIPVLKGAEFLKNEIIKLAPNHTQVHWHTNHDYHAGGYGKNNQETLNFAAKFRQANNISLDKIYTSKAFYAAYDLINKGEIKPNSSVVIIHTGGLQGGLNQV